MSDQTCSVRSPTGKLLNVSQEMARRKRQRERKEAKQQKRLDYWTARFTGEHPNKPGPYANMFDGFPARPHSALRTLADRVLHALRGMREPDHA